MRLLCLLSLVTWHVTQINSWGFSYTYYPEYEGLKTVVDSVQKFSNRFFQVVATKASSNVICSPVSASMVLNMASFGARGETQNEMRSVLALPDRKDLIKIGFRSLISKFLTLPGVELHLANKIFLAEGFIPTDEFRLATLESFGSLPMSLDFTNTVESSRIINTWAANHTKNRVTGLVQSDSLDPTTAMMLVNAVYFKGRWAAEFEPLLTQPRPFFIDGTTPENVMTMQRLGLYRYGELPHLEARYIELPYTSNGRSDAPQMYIILPYARDGITFLKDNIKLSTIMALGNAQQREIHLYLPKFAIASKLELREPLMAMGLKNMFSDKANFSGIANYTLHVSNVIQKVFMEVNEEGSEAAAATSMGISGRMADFEVPPMEFIVEHPFISIIATNRVPLFSAVISDPRS